MQSSICEKRVLSWLGAMLSINVVLTITITVALNARGDTVTNALKLTAPGETIRLMAPSWVDSWWPMLKAHERKTTDPDADLYELFFKEDVKFQYPPTSLLIWSIFPSSMLVPARETRNIPRSLGRLLTWLSQAAVVATVLVSSAILQLGCGPFARDKYHRTVRLGIFFVSVILGLTYYPIVYGHILGQIQVLLNALIAVALLSYLLGWQGWAGILFGACALVKPQYGLALLWSLLRRKQRFSLGFAIALCVGLAVSVTSFGLRDHLRYLDVVQFISRHGESIYLNQSVNGLLNRLLENGKSLAVPGAYQSDFPPYHPFVYVVSTVSSLGMLAFAFWPWSHGRRVDGGPIDLFVILAAATMASPVAWNHHYGTFLPIFAAALPVLIRTRPFGSATGPALAISYAAMANVVLSWHWFFVSPWRGVLASHLLFGGLILFSLLILLREKVVRADQSVKRMGRCQERVVLAS